MSDREQSCEERISSHLAGRLDDFRQFSRRGESAVDAEDWDSADEISEEQWSYPLGVSVQRVVRVDLSTGGPGDWFEIVVDDDGLAERITYHFNDWFDHAERVLSGAEFDLAEQFLAQFVESALVQ